MVKINSYQEKFLSNEIPHRSDSQHEKYCIEIERTSGGLKEHYSKTYGINRRCKLIDVVDFSIFGGGLPHDAMHDILEGVAQYEIKLVVRHCIDLKYISRTEYNH